MATKAEYDAAVEHALSLPIPPLIAVYLSEYFLTGECPEFSPAVEELHRRHSYNRERHGTEPHPTYWLTGLIYTKDAGDIYDTRTLQAYWSHHNNFDYENNKPHTHTHT